MSDADETKIERDRAMILEAARRGPLAKMWAYTKLSGPGWLQSAITLGGGSLAGSLYLGVLAGFSMMWLQPLAMILGVIMLSAIGYVSLSTKERPFLAVRKHVNPVLGWGWAIATMVANLVWCMPQFALGTAALQQNLFPEFFGSQSEMGGKIIAVAVLLIPSLLIVWFYDTGGWGIRLFEWVLKLMVGVVVVSFFVVVYSMSSNGVLDWSQIGAGFIPSISSITEPAAVYRDLLAQAGDATAYWEALIIDQQRSVFISAVATAVGINMTFLLPYSMLQRGWDRDFRGLAIFDLSTGLFIPFILATSCVVISAAQAFHGQPYPGLANPMSGDEAPDISEKVLKNYRGNLDPRVHATFGKDLYDSMTDSGKVAALMAHDDFKDRVSQVGGDKFKAMSPDEQLKALDVQEKNLKSAHAAAFGTLSADEQNAARQEMPVVERELAAMLIQRDANDLAKALQPLTKGSNSSNYLFGIGVLGMAVSTIIILMLINGFVICEMLGIPSKGMPRRLGCLLAGLVGATGPFVWSAAAFWLAIPTSMIGMVLLPIAYISFFFMMNSKSLLGANRPEGFRRLRWNILMGIAVAASLFGSIASILTANEFGRIVGLSLLGGFLVLAAIAHFLRPKADGAA